MAINNGNPRSFFKLVNHRMHSTHHALRLVNADEALISDASQMAAMLNDEFKKNYSLAQCSQPPVDLLDDLPAHGEIASIDISINDVKHLLRQTHSSAAGPDGYPGLVLSTLAEELAYPLLIIFQQSLYQCRVPAAWKETLVTPIYKKKGSPLQPSNYRPVSLTSNIGKVLERIVQQRILHHLASEKLLSPSQHGFSANKSTLTNLLVFDACLATIHNSGHPCDVFTFDFSRTFDRVPHEALKSELAAHGIQGPLLLWLTDFLYQRTQRVAVQGHMSPPSNVPSGVV
jgi:hypothetical protein